MLNRKLSGLYYITHIDNLPSIFEHGILSHAQIEKQDIRPVAIYDREIVNNRKGKLTPDNKSLWEYANFYFQPRNPMLYRVIEEKTTSQIVILQLRKSLLRQPDIWIADGNAAHHETQIMRFSEGLLQQISKNIDREYWSLFDGSKRRIMAECLVPNVVSPDHIETVFVTEADLIEVIRQRVPDKVNVVAEPRMFFRPSRRHKLSEHLFLAEGDMFFSQMQTLTISVNTVGVMGKGLASRAKYQFPDMYVVYEDLCKQKKLQVGEPYLYKREGSITAALSEYQPSIDDQESTWFLLFPTKKHWRDKSLLSYIVDGMQYLSEHYNAWGIKSLALPALGCGLGGLSWSEVGPIVCSSANKLSIKVVIYLPTEQKISEAELTPDFLLR